MRFTLSFLFFILLSLHIIGQAVTSPKEFIPSYGEQFTPHHKVVEYAKQIAANSEYAVFNQYGTTNQGRPLVYLIISDPDNLRQLDDIQASHMESIKGDGDESKALVWLSFGVHGNEAGATESSLNVMYELTKGDNKFESYLKNTIVILDPAINPDGFSRYSHWVRGISTKEIQPEIYAREHNEPWPGGRVNHYLFDLNRDWAWLTQKESQHRLELYNEWLPHIHVDVHEMGHNSHYYFAPAAKPYHYAITQWQKDFQHQIGQNNAKYFDENGWLYFTKEVFDLLYPSYGDTYPTFNGGIGMTYEQAGHSRAGRGIHMENGDTLTLRDRINHHTATTLSTVEMGSQNADKLIQEMKTFFRSSNYGKYGAYIVKRSEGDKLDELTRILDTHKIEYGQASSDQAIKGFNYKTGKEESAKIDKGDLVIPGDQHKSVLAHVLFEPEPGLEDSITYDITAWALPFAQGLDAYAVNGSVGFEAFTSEKSTISPEKKNTAYYISTSHSTGYNILPQILIEGIKCRVNKLNIQTKDGVIPKGSIIITEADNRKNKNWRQQLKNKMGSINGSLKAIETGFALSGPDLGSSSVDYIGGKKIGTFAGSGLNSNSFGQLWYYFEQEINHPLIIVHREDLNESVLSELDVFIITEGRGISSSELSILSDWVSSGGKLIALGRASFSFMDAEGFSLKSKEESNNEKKAEPSDIAKEEKGYIANSIPGAIIQSNVDQAHPLSFGIGDTYHTLRSSSRVIPMQENIRNVVYVPKDYNKYGFIGHKVKDAQEESLVVGVESKGRGTVIYFADNPIYRGFWKIGARLLTNAIFLVDY